MDKALDETLIRQCAPTLAGIKAGSLFCLNSKCSKCLCENIVRWNRLLKNVRVQAIARKGNVYYIYVYRPEILEKLLSDSERTQFLEGFGYRKFDIQSILCKLCERLSADEGFPHEIGIFLDYPLEDVRGFILNGGKNSKRTGTWKVYSDEESSVRTFESFRCCREKFLQKFDGGVPLENLAALAG